MWFCSVWIAHVGGIMNLAPIQTLVAKIGSMFGSGEERPATIMKPIEVQLATPTRRGLLNRSGFVLLLLVTSVYSANCDVFVNYGSKAVYHLARCETATSCSSPCPSSYGGYVPFYDGYGILTGLRESGNTISIIKRYITTIRTRTWRRT